MQFKFEYQDHAITLIFTYLGTEKVFVDGVKVSAQSHSKLKSEHNFFIGEDELQIKSDITGLFVPKQNVSLFRGNVLLETQTQIYNGPLNINNIPKMSKDETDWVSEIEVSNATTIMMFGLYFGLIAFTAGSTFFDDNIISNIGLCVSALSVASAVFSFIRTSYLDLVTWPRSK